jgi:hypothetical protein
MITFLIVVLVIVSIAALVFGASTVREKSKSAIKTVGSVLDKSPLEKMESSLGKQEGVEIKLRESNEFIKKQMAASQEERSYMMRIAVKARAQSTTEGDEHWNAAKEAHDTALIEESNVKCFKEDLEANDKMITSSVKSTTKLRMTITRYKSDKIRNEGRRLQNKMRLDIAENTIEGGSSEDLGACQIDTLESVTKATEEVADRISKKSLKELYNEEDSDTGFADFMNDTETDSK